jgi:flavin-dependent dehydrogenase
VTDAFDVVIAGAGPAGSTTAALLALAGVRVLLLERESFPRFHIGESLAPASAVVWNRLGVRDQLAARYLPKRGVRFLCSRTERAQTFEFAEALAPVAKHAFEVPRADFDELLSRNAARTGADVRHGWEVREALVDRTGAVVGVAAQDPTGARREVRARVVVDATGRETLMAARVALKHRVRGLDRTAVFTHFTGVERQPGGSEGMLDIVVFPHGWLWNIPFRGDVNSVGMVVSATWMRARRAGESLEQFFDRTVADASWARRLLVRARRLNPVRTTTDYSFRVDRVGGQGWLAVGDCVGFVDPLFCSGVHMAFCTGAWAADAIIDALASGGDVSAGQWDRHAIRARRATDLYLGAVQAFHDGPLQDLFLEPDRRATRQTLASLLAGVPSDDVDEPEWCRTLRERFPARAETYDD